MNRQTVQGGSASIPFPFTGDIASSFGNPRVTVTGLQSTPIQDITPSGGAFLQYNAVDNQWQPTSPTMGNSSIQVNGVAVSQDYLIYVNVSRPIKINGV